MVYFLVFPTGMDASAKVFNDVPEDGLVIWPAIPSLLWGQSMGPNVVQKRAIPLNMPMDMMAAWKYFTSLDGNL